MMAAAGARKDPDAARWRGRAASARRHPRRPARAASPRIAGPDRRLRVGAAEAKNHAARPCVAALGIVAMIEGNRQGMALRSRCDLDCADGLGLAPLELVGFDGSAREVGLDPDAAVRLPGKAFRAAQRAGRALAPAPATPKPQAKLVELVRLSQQKALADEGGEVDGG